MTCEQTSFIVFCEQSLAQYLKKIYRGTNNYVLICTSINTVIHFLYENTPLRHVSLPAPTLLKYPLWVLVLDIRGCTAAAETAAPGGDEWLCNPAAN